MSTIAPDPAIQDVALNPAVVTKETKRFKGSVICCLHGLLRCNVGFWTAAGRFAEEQNLGENVTKYG
jgi:hypothetical protein